MLEDWIEYIWNDDELRWFLWEIIGHFAQTTYINSIFIITVMATVSQFFFSFRCVPLLNISDILRSSLWIFFSYLTMIQTRYNWTCQSRIISWRRDYDAMLQWLRAKLPLMSSYYQPAIFSEVNPHKCYYKHLQKDHCKMHEIRRKFKINYRVIILIGLIQSVSFYNDIRTLLLLTEKEARFFTFTHNLTESAILIQYSISGFRGKYFSIISDGSFNVVLWFPVFSTYYTLNYLNLTSNHCPPSTVASILMSEGFWTYIWFFIHFSRSSLVRLQLLGRARHYRRYKSNLGVWLQHSEGL